MSKMRFSPLPFGEDLWITGVIGSMTYIVFLIFMCFFSLSSTSSKWTQDYLSKVIIQFPLNASDVLLSEKAVAILKEDPGIKNYRFIDKSMLENVAKILTSPSLPKVHIPIFIQAEIHPRKWSYERLHEKLQTLHAEFNILDTHDLSSKFMGNITLLMGVFYLLGLIIFAASVLVIFIVTRFEVSVYKDIIHTLYLLGAKDDYICHHFEKRGRKFGFKAGILGSILGTLTCFLFYSFSGGGILWDAAIFIAPLCVLLMVLTPLLCNMICRISSKHYIKILQQKS